MKHRLTFLVIGIFPLLHGCASIVNGQNQALSVTTPGCVGASCELSNDKGKWYVSTTPGSVTVQRSYAELFVKCMKGDFSPVAQSVPSKTKGMAFGNILLGGIIGAGVDVANGSAYDYPNEIALPMTCVAPIVVENNSIVLSCTVKELATVKESLSGFPNGVTGVYVTSVDKGGLADKIGLASGDVLVAFNDDPINDIGMFKNELHKQSMNEPFKIRFWRSGQYYVAKFVKNEGKL